MNKGMGMGLNYTNHMPEVDNIGSKFSNSLAISNIGAYLNSTGSNKSRNLPGGTFKTTASIGSTKGAGKAMLSNT
jgi:hypothetical protein